MTCYRYFRVWLTCYIAAGSATVFFARRVRPFLRVIYFVFAAPSRRCLTPAVTVTQRARTFAAVRAVHRFGHRSAARNRFPIDNHVWFLRHRPCMPPYRLPSSYRRDLTRYSGYAFKPYDCRLSPTGRDCLTVRFVLTSLRGLADA